MFLLLLATTELLLVLQTMPVDSKNTDQCHGRNYGTFVPTYFRSRERKFHRWNFRPLELSLPRAKMT